MQLAPTLRDEHGRHAAPGARSAGMLAGHGADVRDRPAGERLMAARRTRAPVGGDRGLREGDLRARSSRGGRHRSRPTTLAERLRRHARRRRRRWSRSSPSAASSSTCPTSGVALTPAGERVALEVLRHHRLLELYLAEHLGVPWDRVHEEAEALEHVHLRGARGADRGEARQPDARSARRPDPRRATCEIDEGDDAAPRRRSRPGDRGRFVRVSDSDPEMLRYLDRARHRARRRSSRSSTASRSAAR